MGPNPIITKSKHTQAATEEKEVIELRQTWPRRTPDNVEVLVEVFERDPVDVDGTQRPLAMLAIAMREIGGPWTLRYFAAHLDARSALQPSELAQATLTAQARVAHGANFSDIRGRFTRAVREQTQGQLTRPKHPGPFASTLPEPSQEVFDACMALMVKPTALQTSSSRYH